MTDTPFKEVYAKNKKRRGRSKYLLSVDVTVGKENPITARIVCVRNKANRKDWLVPDAPMFPCLKKKSFASMGKDGR